VRVHEVSPKPSAKLKSSMPHRPAARMLTVRPRAWLVERPAQSTPFLVRQVPRVAKLAAVVPASVLVRLHRRHPTGRHVAIESQMIPAIQDVFGRTLDLGAHSKYRKLL
jgi:hypothetical protein